MHRYLDFKFRKLREDQVVHEEIFRDEQDETVLNFFFSKTRKT